MLSTQQGERIIIIGMKITKDNKIRNVGQKREREMDGRMRSRVTKVMITTRMQAPMGR